MASTTKRLSTKNKIVLLILSISTAIAVYFGWRLFWFLTDDAFIAFRYVSNSHLGYGYVWNAAPFRPVEGYTSFLWVALLDVVWRVFGLEPPQSANYISLIFAYLTLFVGALMVMQMDLNERLAKHRVLILALIFLGVITNRTFLAWTSSGLETSMFNFFLTLWIYCALYLPKYSRAWVFATTLVAALLTLTRPDGLLFGAITCGLVTFGLFSNASLKTAPLSGSAYKQYFFAAVPLLIIPAHLLWRHSYYGEWLPNTYFAKTIAGRIWFTSGLRYFLSFVIEYSLWIWLLLLLLVIVVSIKRFGPLREILQVSIIKAAVCFAVLAHFLYYTIIIGGDHFEYRVYSHLILLAFISFLWLLNSIHANPRFATMSFVFLIAFSFPIPWLHWTATHNLEGRQRTVILKASVAKEAQRVFPFTPNFVVAYLRVFDDLQFWLIGHLVCIRHQEHKNFYIELVHNLPSRAEGLAMAQSNFPVLTANSVGVISWVAPRVNVIDLYGLNDYVIARNADTYQTMNMAHERKPPEGYQDCFAPNVFVSGNHFVVNQRAVSLTSQMITDCEQKYADIVKGMRAKEAAPVTPVDNPIDDPRFFLRQQYRDFLNREGDQGGLDNWYETLKPCPTGSKCFNTARESIPVLFFYADEFQQKAFFAYRLYRAAYGREPKFSELMGDQALLQNFPVEDWRDPGDYLPAHRSLLASWVRRDSFRAVYPDALSNEEYVNRLFDNAGLKPFINERLQEVAKLDQGQSREEVLREVAEIPQFKQRESDRAILAMQLLLQFRHDADLGDKTLAPWFEKLESGQSVNFRQFICIVLTSEEYQQRFGSVVTHNNSECR